MNDANEVSQPSASPTKHVWRLSVCVSGLPLWMAAALEHCCTPGIHSSPSPPPASAPCSLCPCLLPGTLWLGERLLQAGAAQAAGVGRPWALTLPKRFCWTLLPSGWPHKSCGCLGAWMYKTLQSLLTQKKPLSSSTSTSTPLAPVPVWCLWGHSQKEPKDFATVPVAPSPFSFHSLARSLPEKCPTGSFI